MAFSATARGEVLSSGSSVWKLSEWGSCGKLSDVSLEGSVGAPSLARPRHYVALRIWHGLACLANVLRSAAHPRALATPKRPTLCTPQDTHLASLVGQLVVSPWGEHS